MKQVYILNCPLVEIMDDGAGRGVELPLHQPVLRSQLQHFAGIKDVQERRPAVLLLCLKDQREFECRCDTWVRDDAPHSLQAVFALHVDRDEGAAEPARLIGAGAHHVLAHFGGHVAGQQQHLAVQVRSFRLRQTALYLPGHIQLKEPLFTLQTSVNVGNWRETESVLVYFIKVKSFSLQTASDATSRSLNHLH